MSHIVITVLGVHFLIIGQYRSSIAVVKKIAQKQKF